MSTYCMPAVYPISLVVCGPGVSELVSRWERVGRIESDLADLGDVSLSTDTRNDGVVGADRRCSIDVATEDGPDHGLVVEPFSDVNEAASLEYGKACRCPCAAR